jgi:hypothetical protein
VSYFHDEPAPYNFIGVQTTLPGGKAPAKQNPIGFVWPKQPAPKKQPVKRGKR